MVQTICVMSLLKPVYKVTALKQTNVRSNQWTNELANKCLLICLTYKFISAHDYAHSRNLTKIMPSTKPAICHLWLACWFYWNDMTNLPHVFSFTDWRQKAYNLELKSHLYFVWINGIRWLMSLVCSRFAQKRRWIAWIEATIKCLHSYYVLIFFR